MGVVFTVSSLTFSFPDLRVDGYGPWYIQLSPWSSQGVCGVGRHWALPARLLGTHGGITHPWPGALSVRWGVDHTCTVPSLVGSGWMDLPRPWLQMLEITSS